MLTIQERAHAEGADFSEAEDDNDAISFFFSFFEVLHLCEREAEMDLLDPTPLKCQTFCH